MNRENRKAQYTALVEQKRITSLFLQPWWLDATGQWDVSLAFRNEQIIGAMPFGIRKKWGITYLGMPSLTHHLRIWMDKPPDITDHKWLTREKQIIWSLIEDLPPYGFFSMVFAENSFDNWLPFHWKGFRQEMRYSFVINRKEMTALEEDINSSYKQKIRKAASIITIQKQIDNKIFHLICSQTYKRQSINVPYSFETFTRLEKAITDHDAGMKLGASDADGKLLAVSYLLWDDDRAYYFLTGDTDEGRKAGAGIYLCYEAIRIAFEEKKVETFDFCGSMLEPVTEIRRQFGARTVPLMKIVKANNKILDIVYKLTR